MGLGRSHQYSKNVPKSNMPVKTIEVDALSDVRVSMVQLDKESYLRYSISYCKVFGE